MKKFLLLQIFVLGAFFSFAQVGIYQSDYYSAGKSIPVISKQSVDIPNLLNLTDITISGFTDEDEQDYIEFFDPSDFAEAISFPTATVAYTKTYSDMDVPVTFFEEITEDYAKVLGVQIDVPMLGARTIVFDNPLVMANFPMLQDDVESTGTATGEVFIAMSELSDIIPPEYSDMVSFLYQGVKATLTITKTSVYAQTGQLTLDGDYVENGIYNYLREYRVFELNFNAQVQQSAYMGGNWQDLGPILENFGITGIDLPIEQTTNNYLYWANYMDYPVLDILTEGSAIAKITTRWNPDAVIEPPTPATYTVSGTVIDNGNNPLANVLINCNQSTTTTAADGTYSFTVEANTTYTVTPSLAGYTFEPESTIVNVAEADETGIDFVGTAYPIITYMVSGTVLDTENNPIEGVTITYNGGSTTTIVDGTYMISVFPGDNLVITASKAGYTFEPASIELNGIIEDMQNQNFVGTAEGGQVAIDENTANIVSVYPNPASDFISINGDIDNFETITIFTINGKILKEEKINSNQVNISDLPAAIYFYQIKYKNETTSKIGKIVKK